MKVRRATESGAPAAAWTSLILGVLNLSLLLFLLWPSVPPALRSTFTAYWIFLGLATLPFFGALYYRFLWPWGYPDVLVLTLTVWMSLAGLLFLIEIMGGVGVRP